VQIPASLWVVGCLPWQDQTKSVSFGGQHRNINLLEISAQIKTFTERIENEGALAAIRDEIQEAETVVFLGFAFHPLNMQLLTPEKSSNAKRVFGTARGLSFTDVQTVNRAVVEMLRGAHASYDNLNVFINNQLSCRALFDEYWRTLSRGV
jgi:hypothetical protein